MNNLKRYKEITGKEFIGNDYSIEQFQNSKAVSNLIKEIEKINHYKHLYSEVKKQKDDVVEYIKSLQLYGFRHGKTFYSEVFNGILRMLGETDVED